MNSNNQVQIFEDKRIRTAWDSATEEWYFSVVDVVAVLTESVDPQSYWRKLKQRLKAEGNEPVTKCHSLKMTAADGNRRICNHVSKCCTATSGCGRYDRRRDCPQSR